MTASGQRQATAQNAAAIGSASSMDSVKVRLTPSVSRRPQTWAVKMPAPLARPLVKNDST